MTRLVPFQFAFAAALVAALGMAADTSRGVDVAAEAPAALTPLEILADCTDAIEKGNFARYVDHLSEREQAHQAGYALFVSSTMLQATVVGSAEMEPETLLFLRAVSGLIDEHTAGSDAAGDKKQAKATPVSPPSPYPVYNPTVGTVAYPAMAVAETVQPGEMFRKSAAKLADPRAFLVDVLTEYAQPVEVTGADAAEASSEPPLSEFVRAFKKQEVTIYTRGDYAIAVPKRAVKASATGAPPVPEEAAAESPPETSPWPLRIEFHREDGRWKITHLLPLAELDPAVGIMANAVYPNPQPQPVCPPAPAVYAPVYAPQPVISAPGVYAPATPTTAYPGSAAASPASPASFPE